VGCETKKFMTNIERTHFFILYNEKNFCGTGVTGFQIKRELT
jgi:hypothetical protein